MQARNLQSNLTLKVLQYSNNVDLSFRTSTLLDENQVRSCKTSYIRREMSYTSGWEGIIVMQEIFLWQYLKIFYYPKNLIFHTHIFPDEFFLENG